MEEEDEDRISRLPDCLLADILSRLPSTKHAIRTGTLSKRWQHMWTSVPNLTFVHRYTQPNADFFSFVDKTLTQRRQLKLKKFKVHSTYSHRFEPQVRNWIRYAINCNVEEIDLELRDLEHQIRFPLDQCFFISSCFTDLRLKGCTFNPTGAISWKKLKSLYIFLAKLDEDLIENILSGSPVLETLVLEKCFGFTRINITSKSVKNLVFYGSYFCDLAGVEINAPNILSLSIQDYLPFGKLLLIDVSSLVKADLDYALIGPYETTLKEAEEDMLKGLILNLSHVKELKIRGSCFEVLTRLEAEGFTSPSNLKVLDKL